jgi:hypothetical protein
MSPEAQLDLFLGMFACGAVAGALSRWGTIVCMDGMLLPVMLPPVSIGLMMSFC